MHSPFKLVGFGAFALGLILTAAAQAAVVAAPDSVTITSQTQTVSIGLTSDGKPVPAKAIKGYTFNVENRTYEFMISMKKRDGGVDITPTNKAEVGIYTFTINTSAGAAVVTVNMPLNEMPDSTENEAKAQGITVDELLVKKGISKPYGRTKVLLDFPGPYVAGDVLRIVSPAPAGTNFTWSVNGKVVKEGVGPEVLEYTFPAAGSYAIVYRESKDGAPVGEGKATATVGEKK